MATVRFTATRSVVAPYVQYNDYNVLVKVRYGGMTKGRRATNSQRVTFDGHKETYRFRANTIWELNTIAMTATDQAIIKMFLDSTESGELFEFGEDDVNFVTAILVSDGYQFTRDSSLDSRASVSFTISSYP